MMKLCIAAAGLSSMFALTAALWQHVASAATTSLVGALSHGEVVGHVGPAATALAWLGFGLTAIVTIAVTVLLLSIQLLDRLTDE